MKKEEKTVKKSVPSLHSQISLCPTVFSALISTEAKLSLQIGYKILKERGEKISTQYSS